VVEKPTKKPDHGASSAEETRGRKSGIRQAITVIQRKGRGPPEIGKEKRNVARERKERSCVITRHYHQELEGNKEKKKSAS